MLERYREIRPSVDSSDVSHLLQSSGGVGSTAVIGKQLWQQLHLSCAAVHAHGSPQKASAVGAPSVRST